MKHLLRLLLVTAVAGWLVLSPSSHAQDEPRAAWAITNYDIAVPAIGNERALSARAVITARNIGRGAGATLTVRINPTAEVKAVTVGGATATFQSRPETRGNSQRGASQRVTINLPSSVTPGQSVAATVDYRLPITENSGAAALSPVGSQFLPQSMWFPQVNTEFSVRGADYAPFRLTINGASALSSGIDKSSGGGNSVFEQSLNAQPFFVTGAWDRIDGGANAKGISAYIAKGAGADERKQAESLIALASDARNFYATLFGAAPDVPVRIIGVNRAAGFEDAGAILLGNGAFQRKTIDSSTAMTIGEAIARLWIGADTPVRGDGYGVVREGLPRFLATLFLEKQFGADAAEAERGRERVAYAAIAKRDGPLSRTSALDPTYLNAVANKGAMVWRLLDSVVGHDTFISTLKGLLASSKTDVDGLTLAATRAAFAARGNSVKALIDQQLDQTTDTDLLAGLPVQKDGQWTAALRNLGSTEVTVNVAGATSTGQRVTTQATIPAHDFGQATFKSSASIVSVEVDPDKLYPQLDYANDVAPKVPEIAESLGEANRLYGAQEYAKAEALARQMLAASPRLQDARIVLGRTLLAENKNDEAEREFKQLLTEKLPLPASLAWASYGLGEIALRRGQAAEASRLFTDAIRADAEYASTLTARAARIRAEPSPAIDQSVVAFVNQLDTAIRTGKQAEIGPLIVPGELGRFVKGLVGTQPEAWQTRVLRTEPLGADRMAADVSLNTKQLGVEHSGTAVLIFARAAASWKLDAIEFFEVR
ncbi:MAG TPA: tetratricopeptide repeat protein [Pyrinomonadaceae bacterium]|nr:tetratricopeptide repeat protein [Pyrinomonadaceae bacterium]